MSEVTANTEFERKVSDFISEWLSDSKTVKVQTSGSTGTPKIFEIKKDKMLHSAKMTCDILALKEDNSALLCLPIEYISGKMMVVRAIERKLKLLVKSPSSQPLNDLKEGPEYFKTFNSPNGWGMYENFVPFVEKYLEACKDFPDALIEVSR